MNEVESIILDFLKAIIANVGVEQLAKLVAAAVGKDDAARVRSIIEAEYAATDAAVDVLEDQKLAGEHVP